MSTTPGAPITLRSEDESLAILERALAAAAADEADAVLTSTDQNISRFANSQIHQNMSEESASLTLRVVLGASMGVASTTVFTDEEIARTAALAREAARHASPLPGFSGLYRGGDDARPSRAAMEAPPITAEEKARDLRTMFDAGRVHDATFAGSYATGVTAVACASSHGVRRYARTTFADATVIAITPRHSGYATRRERRAAEVGIVKLGEEAITKATLAADAVEDLEPGAYDVILEPPAIAEVLDWMNMIAFSGQSFEDGSSFFVGHLGQKMLGDAVTLVDDAEDPSFLPFPFDMEGLPKRAVTLVENGIVRTPVVDKAYADRLRIAPTGNCWQLGSPDHGSAFHLSMNGGTSSRQEMLASTKLGIWVTRFNYVNGLLEPRTALMTGTTRDGTFLIRDGRVAARLPNLRWTQSMTEAFSNVEALSSERRIVGTWYNPFGGTRAPVAKIRGWHFTGKQRAAE